MLKKPIATSFPHTPSLPHPPPGPIQDYNSGEYPQLRVHFRTFASEGSGFEEAFSRAFPNILAFMPEVGGRRKIKRDEVVGGDEAATNPQKLAKTEAAGGKSNPKTEVAGEAGGTTEAAGGKSNPKTMVAGDKAGGTTKAAGAAGGKSNPKTEVAGDKAGGTTKAAGAAEVAAAADKAAVEAQTAVEVAAAAAQTAVDEATAAAAAAAAAPNPAAVAKDVPKGFFPNLARDKIMKDPVTARALKLVPTDWNGDRKTIPQSYVSRLADLLRKGHDKLLAKEAAEAKEEAANDVGDGEKLRSILASVRSHTTSAPANTF